MSSVHLPTPTLIPLLLTLLLTLPFTSPKIVCTALMGSLPNTIKSVTTSLTTATFIASNPTTNVSVHMFFNFTDNGGRGDYINTTIVRQDPRADQLRGGNTLFSNVYLITNNVGCTVEINNFSSTVYSAAYAVTNARSIFGNSTNQFYQMFQTGNNHLIKHCTKTTIYTCTQILSFSNQTNLKLLYRSNKLHLYSQSTSSPNSGLIRIYSSTHTLVASLPIDLTNMATTAFDIYQGYLAVSVNLNVYVYDVYAGYVLVNSFGVVTGATVSDLKVMNWTVLVAVDNKVSQFGLLSGFEFATASSYTPYGAFVEMLEGCSRFLAWMPGTTDYIFFNYTETYDCILANSCTCIPNFCHDPLQVQCLPCFPPRAPPSAPAPVTVLNGSSCYLSAGAYCQLYCKYSCGSCTQGQAICDACSSYYQPEGANCVLSGKMQALLSLLSLLNIFRLKNAQVMYFFVGNLQLYIYHETNYDGIIQEVLQFMDFVQEQLWSLVSQEQFLDWSAQPFLLPSYNAYTNPKYLEVERKDSLFFQNTKTFVTIYIPFVLALFCILNRLFYFLYEYKISSFLRVYSIWLYLVVQVANQNADILTFLAIQDFKDMFSLDYSVYISKAVSTFFYGFIFVLTIAVFPLSCYFYADLSKYFLSNTYRIRYSFLLTAIRFTGKPILESMIHSLLYSRPVAQLLTLAAINLCTILLLLLMEANFDIFIVKTIFIFECALEFNLLLFNVLVYLKYYVELSPVEVIEECIVVVMYLFVFISASIFFCSVLVLFWPNRKDICSNTERSPSIPSVKQEKDEPKRKPTKKQKTKLKIKQSHRNIVQKYQKSDRPYSQHVTYLVRVRFHPKSKIKSDGNGKKTVKLPEKKMKLTILE